ncbi:hypothetical protein [Aerosakkonema funiforme]|uniref:hypothetical protein n=1 Tax=Aerosakkonema funiforme TaxID=1246630 RepID=UPI0035BBEAB1
MGREENMATERWNDEMLDRLAGIVEANTQGIADLRSAVERNTQGIESLRVLVGDLREGQALLTQMLVEEREARQEFRRTTNAALDRIDRTLEELKRNRDNGN